MTDRSPTDEQLVEHYLRLQGTPRGHDCLKRLLGRYESRISAWCLAALKHREDAADCVQEILLRLCRGLPDFRRESRFGTWVYVVTRRATIDAINSQRNRRNERALSLAVHSVACTRSAPLDGLQAREAQQLFLAIFARHMTEREWIAMILHHVEGQSTDMITRELGLVNRSGARALLVSARRKLRQRVPTSCLRDIGSALSGGHESVSPLSDKATVSTMRPRQADHD